MSVEEAQIQRVQAKLQELEDLEALLASQGWARFLAYVDREYGPVGYRAKAQQILGGVSAERQTDAATLLLQLESSTREIERLFAWVKERVQNLRGAHASSR